ncbi:carboxypeptidase regulatory-like domain-containing protein [Flavobacterium silvisoli]|uniref:Carboxypeptidase regulatory-like domain-containing protein n=1 Tax=Flavobacterium silvisoli TaxID=2529433 RepID=A0A4V2L5I1_9FLAO|nr:carboxypeptidase-like regulatory domain-containing protein [Flavobacterium silvisoli]TBX70569.1 carboxypeptidase regulatory-like domain-containing protein [Flavobacterium silvisoli]
MKIKSILIAFFAVIFLTISCSKDDSSGTSVQPTGTITGKLMVKNGTKPVGGALVFVFDDNNKIYRTITQANGDFSLQAPVGQRKLYMQTGDGANFRTSLQVTVVKDQTLTIDASLSRLDQVANMAYVAGSYDEIQDIVTGLGYTITQISNADLADYSKVSQYDIIFLNCGAKQGYTNPVMDTNLANFVTNGGSLYASDWAVAYLTGGGSNSSSCGLAGGFIPDDKLCSKNTGSSMTIMGAQVADTNLASALGFSSLDIQYDLGSWQRIFSYEPTYWDVLVSDPATNQPLMIKTNMFNSGTVSSPVGGDDNDGWVTICHTDESGNPVTITIEESAWAAHEAHGDSIGACSSTNNSGTIYYTTFHNHASGNIGNSGLILEYVILNL